MRLRNSLKEILPDGALGYIRWIRNAVYDVYATKSYSQEGEDMILRRIFEDRSEGFYVDVGAHHPKRFSNTYLFYRAGWSGINVDATPGSMAAFRKSRPRDINVEVAISEEPGEAIFYLYNEPALNSFQKRADLDMRDGMYRVIGETKVPTRRLEEVLAEHLGEGQRIDFLSVDAENMDLEVLQSNNWQRFRPGYVLVEYQGGSDIEQVDGNETSLFLEKQGYALFAKTLNTLIFKESDPRPGALER